MLRFTWRTLLARKVRLVMSTLAIVLGIGFLTGVMVFSNGLGSTFDAIIKGSTPDALVRPTGTGSFESVGAGTTTVLKPEDVARLAALPEVARADGQVDGLGSYLLDADGKLVGGQGAPTIAFNDNDYPNILDEPSLELLDGAWPRGTDEIVLDSGAADNGGYEVGDEVTVIAPNGTSVEGARHTFTLAGTAEFNGGGTAGATLLVFSTPGAQELFLGGRDVFTSAALTAAPGVSQEQLAAAAEDVLPAAYEVMKGDTVVKESQDSVNEFLGVITQFLVAFAVIAILVGGFIIANTFTILVAQRVRELALLRALGASAAQVRRSVLLEATLMALLGSTIGVGLGLVLSRALATLFSSFGLDIAGDALTLTWPAVALAYGVGLAVTLVSAYLPARRASRTAPVAAMRDEAAPPEQSLRRRALIGTVVVALGAAAAGYGFTDGAPGPAAAWVGGAAVVWVLTAAALSPVIGHPVLVATRALFARAFGTTGRLAGDNALRNPRRTGATASALMIGVALVSAVGTLAASFSATADDLVDDQFASDFLVQSANFQTFPTGIGDDMAEVDGVAMVTRDQFSPALVDGKPGTILGVDPDYGQIYDLDVTDGTQDLSGKEAVISTDAADDYGVGLGDRLGIAVPGDRSVKVEVVGIIEPTPVVGAVNVPLSVLTGLGLNRADTSVSINIDEGADREAVQRDLERVVADVPIVTVQDKEEFADSILAQINTLLSLIYGLLALAVVIAVIGIINTLGLSVIERTREIGLLRAVGLSRARLRTMVTLESVTIAVMGAVLGMVVGLAIGVLLRQSLRDDLTALALPLPSLGVFLGIAVVFGVVAAVVPAIRASRMKVLDAIATE